MDSVWIRISAAAVASLALHGGLFFGIRPSGSVAPGTVEVHPLLVRMLTAAVEPTDAGVQERSHNEPGIRAPLEEDASRRDAADASRRAPVRAPRVEPVAVAPTPMQARSKSQPAESLSEATRSPAAAGDRPAPAPQPVEAGLPPAPAYLFGARLDPGPRPLGDIDPVFPPEAGLQEGVVVLRILVSETGIVDEVAVVRSSPKGLFENSALTAFGSAKFAPGMLLGTPVKSQITVEVNFTPFNRGATVSGRGY